MRGVLYLASTSPRRRALLQAAGIDFELHPPGEEPAGAGTPEELAIHRAAAKAHGAPLPEQPGWILGVDTVVGLGRTEFGKPSDRAAAAEMLQTLRGKTHTVFSAHCLVRAYPGDRDGRPAFAECAAATVRCREFSAAELSDYLDGDDWADKAGAYGIQGAGGSLMTLESGALDTVIGLHVDAVRRLLAEAVGA